VNIITEKKTGYKLKTYTLLRLRYQKFSEIKKDQNKSTIY